MITTTATASTFTTSITVESEHVFIDKLNTCLLTKLSGSAQLTKNT